MKLKLYVDEKLASIYNLEEIHFESEFLQRCNRELKEKYNHLIEKAFWVITTRGKIFYYPDLFGEANDVIDDMIGILPSARFWKETSISEQKYFGSDPCLELKVLDGGNVRPETGNDFEIIRLGITGFQFSKIEIIDENQLIYSHSVIKSEKPKK